MNIPPGLIDRFKDKHICVVGDVIADIYIYGKPHKLSREAPVVVIRYERESICPGSAGNTINNLLALGAYVHPVSCIGRDEAGDRLYAHFSGHKKIDLEGFVRYDGRTVTKTRILAGDTHTSKQQVIRVDREMEAPLPEELRQDLRRKLAAIAPLVDAIVGPCPRSQRRLLPVCGTRAPRETGATRAQKGGRGTRALRKSGAEGHDDPGEGAGHRRGGRPREQLANQPRRGSAHRDGVGGPFDPDLEELGRPE